METFSVLVRGFLFLTIFLDVEVGRKVALLEVTFMFCYFFHMILIVDSWCTAGKLY